MVRKYYPRFSYRVDKIKLGEEFESRKPIEERKIRFETTIRVCRLGVWYDLEIVEVYIVDDQMSDTLLRLVDRFLAQCERYELLWRSPTFMGESDSRLDLLPSKCQESREMLAMRNDVTLHRKDGIVSALLQVNPDFLKRRDYDSR